MPNSPKMECHPKFQRPPPPRPGTEEEETIGEHLVIEGVDEATHDQMLEARKEERDQEGGNPEPALLEPPR